MGQRASGSFCCSRPAPADAAERDLPWPVLRTGMGPTPRDGVATRTAQPGSPEEETISFHRHFSARALVEHMATSGIYGDAEGAEDLRSPEHLTAQIGPLWFADAEPERRCTASGRGAGAGRLVLLDRGRGLSAHDVAAAASARVRVRTRIASRTWSATKLGNGSREQRRATCG